MPWVHYVPVKLDYGDIYDVLAFFRGLPDGTPGHEELAEKIASAGRRWVEQFWRNEVCNHDPPPFLSFQKAKLILFGV